MDPQQEAALLDQLRELDPRTAADRIAALDDRSIGALLCKIHTGYAVEILEEFPLARRRTIAAATPSGEGQSWLAGHEYAEGTVGRLLERAPAVFRADDTIAHVTEALREIVKRRMVVYIFVTEGDGHLLGVVAFRELLFARPEQTLRDVMLPSPFFLKPETPLLDAMQEVVTRHYPVYPVCDASGKLLGQVKGQVLFEQQAYEISAQAGSMVGVEKEERLATPWVRSFVSRHPWLQLNLLTAFVAAGVVGFFQHTLEQIVVLAVFLSVLSGQSGNTGCQALAVTLRGITLGELRADNVLATVSKEAWLGFLNGAAVGLVAGIGMYVYAIKQNEAQPLLLGIIVAVSMVISCVTSGIAGALIPLGLRRLGADPATASSIFLTTATDVISMGTFLGFATWWLL